MMLNASFAQLVQEILVGTCVWDMIVPKMDGTLLTVSGPTRLSTVVNVSVTHSLSELFEALG